MKYSDEQRIEKILKYAVKLQSYIAENSVTTDKLLTEEKLQWLVTTPLYNIGEHTYNLSKELKTAYQNIQWDSISGLRHRLVHDYEGVKWGNISKVIFEDLPNFTEQLKEICKENGWTIKDIEEIMKKLEKDKEFDARFRAIRDIDIEAKPKTNAEKLQRFCKKAMEAHGEGYEGYVADGVKMFLKATPGVKLEQMTQLIDAVAPDAVYDSDGRKFSDRVKSEILQDKNFQAKISKENKPAKGTSR